MQRSKLFAAETQHILLNIETLNILFHAGEDPTLRNVLTMHSTTMLDFLHADFGGEEAGFGPRPLEAALGQERHQPDTDGGALTTYQRD